MKPAKKRVKAEKAPVMANSDEGSENEYDESDSEPSFQAVTKFKLLKPGCYYKIVSLGKDRQRNRIVAVPVKGFEGLYKNFNHLVQQ